ncbi:MAG: ATP-binding protein [Mucilaginibacter sp.]
MLLKTHLVMFLSNYSGAYFYVLVAGGILLAVVFFFVALPYYRKLQKIADEKRKTESQNFDISVQFDALLTSLNDIIFEFNEDKVCLNVWFNDTYTRVIDPKSAVGKKLDDVIGPEKAKKFNDTLDYVIKHRKPTSLVHPSDFGTGKWFNLKVSPVFDRNGNYTSRISGALTDITEEKKYESALKENELLLQEAQLIAKTGNWWYDHATKETFWSDNLFTILEVDEIPPSFATKLDYYISLVHPADREKTFQYFKSLHSTSAEAYFEHKLFTPRGHLKYFKVIKGNLFTDSSTHTKRTSGVIQDITESRLAEKAIKLSRTELIEAQNIAKIGNWKWDTISKKITWSDEVGRIFETAQSGTTEFGIKKLLLKFVAQDDKLTVKRFLKNISETNTQSIVFKITTPAKKIKYLSVIVGKLIRRDDGSVRKIVGTLQDITARKEAEIAYQKTEDKYKLVLETVKLAALSLDKNGIVIFCNFYLANLLGYDQREILGRRWLDFIPEGAAEVIQNWYATSFIKPQYINPVICRNGEQRIISWQNTVTYNENGEIQENTAIGEDITDKQRATEELISAKESAEKASEFKSEFLSIMSHEIRTPMNAVIGTTNLLLSEDPKPDQLEYLNILKFSADNLLAIINDILDYNKIEAGKLELYIDRFNLWQLTQKIRKSFLPKALEKMVEIELSIDETVPELVLGDQMRLSQILNNLLSNAVKFTQKGKITIKLEDSGINDTQATVKFYVTDSGIGIAPENLQVIFDPFMQESQYINSNNGGTGLGLAITKRLVELHKSTIQVTSELGKGTQFTFTITFDLPLNDKKEIITEIELVSLNLYGMKILLVDDNMFNLLIAANFLKKWQANVDEAYNGQIAIDMVNADTYDLVLMDLQMPVMDGFEATRIIKQTHPNLPIIALTADAMPETQEKALNTGMVDYLTKPFVPAVFYEKIAKFYKPRD